VYGVKIGVILPVAEVAGPGRTADWPTIRAFALAAEDRGLDSVWMIDHFFNQTSDGGREGMHEAWTVVSAVAAVTTRVEIGTLVLCTPFRNPGLVAKMAATAQEISAGRIILGLGAGWHEPEFAAFGYPFDHRVDRFAEALPAIASLLRGESVTHDGSHHRLRSAAILPPAPYDVPILVAASGPRMLRLTARYADAWNTAWYGRVDDRLRANLLAMDRALDAEGRDPASLTRTVGVFVQDPDSDAPSDPDEPEITGSVSDLARELDAYEALGIDHLIVQPLPHVEHALDRLAAASLLRSGDVRPTLD
jgi:alkanesulfonate monooxygenase SsuD/methylene tetrahydromethanopterin reductase-like flavin-dependent oxidoreductase (luciferase family)